jgi:mRNA-degrading endonuclease RelE of RelBE toxin-antitoxin system
MYSIEFTKQAAQALKAMPRNAALTIRAKIDLLANDPYSMTNVRNWRVVTVTDCELATGVFCSKSTMASSSS